MGQGLQINHSCYEFNRANAMSSSTWKTVRQHSSPSSCPHVLPASPSMLPLSFGDGDTDVPFVVTLTSHFPHEFQVSASPLPLKEEPCQDGELAQKLRALLLS